MLAEHTSFVVRHLYGYVSMFQFPDLKVFARRQDISSGRSVAQSWSPYAEILDGSFLQPHILLPPLLLLSATISFSSSAASSHPTLAGVAAEPAYPPKNTTHRLRHPPATFFFPPLFYCFFPFPPSFLWSSSYSKKFTTYESHY